MVKPGDRCVGGGLDHHMECETANGPVSMGTCRKCGLTRPLWNSPPLKDFRRISSRERRIADEFGLVDEDGDGQIWE